MSNDFRPQIEKNVTYGTNFGLSAPCPTAKAWSSMKFQVVNGNPRIQVYSNDPEDKIERGIMSVRMHPVQFQAVIVLLDRARREQPGWKAAIEIEEFDFTGGKRSDRPEVRWRIIVGKNSEGVISIMVQDKKYDRRPRIPFEISAPRFIPQILGANGEPFSKAELSDTFTQAWVEKLTAIMAVVEAATWKEPQKRESNQRGGGGGRGNYGGGGGRGNDNYGGNSNSGGSSGGGDFDDDMPF